MKSVLYLCKTIRMCSASVCVILCLAMMAPVTASSFNFRDNCYVTHMGGVYNCTCDANQGILNKHLDLNEQNTRGIYKLELKGFNSVTFYSMVQVQIINITDVPYVDLILNFLELKEVTLSGVHDLILKHPGLKGNNLMNMLVKDVNRMRLISENAVWRLKSVKLEDVKDMNLNSKKITISAENLNIESSQIEVGGELSLKAALVNIGKDTKLHFLNKSYMNVIATEFTVKDSEIYMENSIINLKSNKATFSTNSFYNFNKNSVSTVGHTIVKLENNCFFTENMFDILSSDVEHVVHVKSQFDCNNCSVRGKMVATDLGKLGDENYCYSDCHLTLNNYKWLLENNYFCNPGETTVNHTVLCEVKSTDKETVTDIDLLRWFLLFLIPLMLLIALLSCICHRENRKKLKELALVNILPRELECERRQMSLQRDCNNESYYEEVGPPYTCK